MAELYTGSVEGFLRKPKPSDCECRFPHPEAKGQVARCWLCQRVYVSTLDDWGFRWRLSLWPSRALKRAHRNG